MSVAPSYVQVAPDSTGKRIDNVTVTTAAGLVERQVVVPGDPENPDAYAAIKSATPAANAYAMAVRDAWPNVDTGIQAPNSGVLVDATGVANDLALLLDGVAIVNNGGAATSVAVANGSGQYLIAPFELADKASLVIPCYGRPVVGLRFLGAAGVTLQAWGRS